MHAVIRELRYAVRALLRSPGFTVVAVITLALGIGANTAIFSVIDPLLFKSPAHVRDPGHLVRLYFRFVLSRSENVLSTETSVPTYAALRDGVRAFQGAAAFADTKLSVGRGAEARPATVGIVSASYFHLLGVHAARGRLFGTDADRSDGERVAVLGHQYWRTQLGADPGVLGRLLAVGGGSYTVIGVAPEGFVGANREEPDVWLPLGPLAAEVSDRDALTSYNSVWIAVVARLARGADPVAAASEATAVLRRDLTAGTGRSDTTTTVVLGPIQAERGPLMSSDARVSLWVAAVAGVVLLIACANVANLMLARGVRRRRQISIRLALGASRFEVGRQLLVESLLLAAAGGSAAFLVEAWGGELLRRSLLSRVTLLAPAFDTRVLAFMAAAALAAGLLTGLAPALGAGRVDIASTLTETAPHVASGRSRLQEALLVAQIALTLVLLAGAGLFVRSLRNALAIDPGVDLDHVLQATVGLGSAEFEWGQSDAVYRLLLDRIRAFPGVTHAAASLGTPYGANLSASGIRVSGRDSVPGARRILVYAVTPDFFPTLGIRIVRGRGFSAADERNAGSVAVVSSAFARLAWPDRDPLVQCLYVRRRGAGCVHVVGVAEDARMLSLMEQAELAYYMPHEPSRPISALLIRTAGNASDAAPAIQRALQSAAPGLPYVQVRTLDDAVAPELRSWRLGASLFSVFAVLALLIASLGTYATASYWVGQRTHEIGVRIALGAPAARVLRMVVAQGIGVAALGVALGGAGAYALGRAIATLLYGVKPGDPLVLGLVVVILVGVVALASLVPAWRAARVDPVVALRSE